MDNIWEQKRIRKEAPDHEMQREVAIAGGGERSLDAPLVCSAGRGRGDGFHPDRVMMGVT